MNSGRIEVITGPMFSGKSEELIRRLRRATIAKLRIACFKPAIDNRYNPNAISSHSQLTIDATPVKDIDELVSIIQQTLDNFDVIGIDEAQFFDPAIVVLVSALVKLNKRIIIAGLDMTFSGEPFAPMPDLMAIADEVLKLSAVCTMCGSPAVHTNRLVEDTTKILVGTAKDYDARCRECFEK